MERDRHLQEMMNRKSKGLTLVEILVVVTILSILVASLYVVFKSAIDTWTKSKARLDIIQNARVILDQLSRELPGAFVDSAVFADFVGTDGGGTNSDTLEFVTFFAGKIYKLRYDLIAGDILERGYIENPPDYQNVDYDDASADEDDGIAEARINFGFMVNDIQFYYLPVREQGNPSVDPASTDWNDPGPPLMTGWDSTDTPESTSITGNKLPEAVKIVLQLIDNDSNTYDFETIVYLPNSTANQSVQ